MAMELFRQCPKCLALGEHKRSIKTLYSYPDKPRELVHYTCFVCKYNWRDRVDGQYY